MSSESQEMKAVVASDVCLRDGIGVEIYFGDRLVMEVFRDDTKRTREVTLYERDLPLNVVEKSIAFFREKIPWDFIECDEDEG